QLALALRRKHEELLLEGIYQTAVAGVPVPTPDEVLSFYDKVKDRYQHLSGVELMIVTTPDSTAAELLARSAGRSRPLAQAAQAASPPLTASDTTIAYPTASGEWNALLAMFTSMEPGGCFGPVRTAGGWRVLQLVTKAMQEQPFAELAPAAQ